LRDFCGTLSCFVVLSCALGSICNGHPASEVVKYQLLVFGSLLKQIRQSRVPAVRAGQRPVLARNDPLHIFGNQRQQTLLIAAAHC
jgi:hypothetical protein